MDSSDHVLVEVAESRRFIERCMVAKGTSPAHAALLAELLVSADHRGHYSHGLNRIGSNHYGIAGWYSMRIKDAGMIGLSFTNTSPCVFPIRSKEIIIGTNPIACSAPANDGDSFDLDMATTTVAYGKVEICHLKGETLPSGWGSDSQGKETRDPGAVFDGGGLQPLGGGEITGGYKGTGLALIVEVLTGILGGAHFGSNIRTWRGGNREADLGQCFVAINPTAFAPGYSERMTSLLAMCRNAEPANGEMEVLVAGDPERRHADKVDSEGGIRYHRNLITKLDILAERLDVEPILPKKT